MDLHVLATVLALVLGQCAAEAERKIEARRVLAAMTGAMTRVDPRAITFVTEEVRFGQRLGSFLFFELLHPSEVIRR